MNNKIKLRTPGYYKNFHCISSECKDNCCVGGWQIDIDEETAEYYSTVNGDFGKNYVTILIMIIFASDSKTENVLFLTIIICVASIKNCGKNISELSVISFHVLQNISVM